MKAATHNYEKSPCDFGGARVWKRGFGEGLGSEHWSFGPGKASGGEVCVVPYFLKHQKAEVQ